MYNDEQIKNREQIVSEYAADLDKLIRYLPWLEKKKSSGAQKYYEGDGSFSVIPVPVYDSTLLAFVKEARTTKFMNKNYPYVYRRFNLKTPADELKAISRARIQDMDLLCGILSRYVMLGQTKGVVWTEGLSEGIYVAVLKTMNKLFYDHSSDSEKLIH